MSKLNNDVSGSRSKVKDIFLVTSANFPYGGAGANVLRLLTTGLVKSNRNVNVLLQRGKQFGAFTETVKRRNTIEGVGYSYCGFVRRPKNIILKMLDTCAGQVIPLLILVKRKIEKRIDCIILYNGSAYECILILLACRLCNIKIINYVVEWYEKETVSSSWWTVPLWWDFSFRMKVLNKHFDGLIVTSSFLKEYYVNNGVSDKRILIRPNLVDISIFQPHKNIENKEGSRKRIGYCGTPTHKDGINDLLKAFQTVQKKHRDAELLVIGDTAGNTSLIPGLKKKTEDLGISEKVVFTGLVDWSQIPDLLNSCDILVLARPSGRFAEAGFPTKLGEYMSCGKPVVATRVGDIPLYFRDKENAMLAEPDNPDSVADSICYLLDRPAEAGDIGAAGFIWAKETLDYHEASKKVGRFLDLCRNNVS